MRLGDGSSSLASQRSFQMMARIEPFETHARRYDAWFDRHAAAYQSEVAALRSLGSFAGRWLEVGVGTGRFAVPLEVHLGVEPSRAMARVARQRGIQVVRAVAEHLPLPNRSLDGILFVTTICFVDDLTASLREAHRVLRADGDLVVGFVDRESSLGREYLDRRTRSVFYRAATFVSTEELLERLDRTGFRPSAVLQTIFHRLDDLRAVEAPETGSGRGSFVALRAKRVPA